jgi:hypothetical protein
VTTATQKNVICTSETNMFTYKYVYDCILCGYEVLNTTYVWEDPRENVLQTNQQYPASSVARV